MKIATIVGARPQFIKFAMVSHAFKEHRPDVRQVIIHTGQHFDANMSDVFFDELDIPQPDYNLGIGGGTHGQNTGRMIEAIETALIAEKPDWVVVYGDTDSTLAGALAAVKLNIPVAHVEAGLRSFNRRMPEEINRVLTDHTSSLLFTPTDIATCNLINEGIIGEKVQQVGDVMYDAALFYARKAKGRISILNKLQLEPNRYILATVHRAENTDDHVRLTAIFESLIAASQHQKVVVPLHPRTRAALNRAGLQNMVAGTLTLCEPLGYLDMITLELNAAVIATDSGGVQKEAFFYQVPCVTLREETEWVELVEAGCNRLAGANTELIKQSIIESNGELIWPKNLYGDGNASVHICTLLMKS